MLRGCRSTRDLRDGGPASRRLCDTLRSLVLPLIAVAAPGAAQAATFDCLIEPRLKVELAAPAAGVLKEVLVDRGDRVRKGDILARLDSAVEEATVALDKARAASEAAIES